ncbi:MAG: transposase [Gammaproteobacteria bacterium]|nr:transposase [Gammaproteobacteria bacterium]
MPRPPRLHVPGGLYHIIMRGNGRQTIFFNDADRQYWQSLLATGIQRRGHRLHAYCWMSNHVHMMIQNHADPLAGFLGTLASSYARGTNRRLGRSGHLFERRYRAILIQQDAHALELVRYIHRNPVRSAMVADPADYPWSSHGAYLHGNAPGWLTTEWLLGLLGTALAGARRAYASFMAADADEAGRHALCNGRDDDPRILGDDQFARTACDQATPVGARQDLNELVRATCERYGVSDADLAVPSRNRLHARVRAEIARAAIDGRAATLTEVARRFGRSPSALCRRVSQLRRGRDSQ